jgi:glutathione synthase/RimK-type ligase-like ATP-grasp enzyme
MIVTRFSQLIRDYHRLGTGDVFIGQVPSSYLKSAILTDLTERGVRLVPSATAQVLNASKVAQAFLLNPWMVPHTLVITRRKELLDAVTTFSQKDMSVAITKADCLHCGHGVRKWDNLETLYNCLSFDEKAFPFVLQPWVTDFMDVRVVMVGDYCEAYSRRNLHNFRMNLAAGGHSEPHVLTQAQTEFCRGVLARAGMPYAHLDLMLLDDGSAYLSEIRLNGGIQGARIQRNELEQMKQARLMELAERL